MATFGEVEDRHFNVGADLRFLEQNITEDVFINSASFSGVPFSQTISQTCRGQSARPSAFAEYVMPLSSFWTTTVGAPWISTTRASFDELRPNGQLLPGLGGPGDLDQEDVLCSFFLTNQVELDCNWTLLGGFGTASAPRR
jgi:hypothetical protein